MDNNIKERVFKAITRVVDASEDHSVIDRFKDYLIIMDDTTGTIGFMEVNYSEDGMPERTTTKDQFEKDSFEYLLTQDYEGTIQFHVGSVWTHAKQSRALVRIAYDVKFHTEEE